MKQNTLLTVKGLAPVTSKNDCFMYGGFGVFFLKNKQLVIFFSF